MYEHLVGSAAFKAAETGDPRLAGSIPVHLRHFSMLRGPARRKKRVDATCCSWALVCWPDDDRQLGSGGVVAQAAGLAVWTTRVV